MDKLNVWLRYCDIVDDFQDRALNVLSRGYDKDDKNFMVEKISGK
jgi:hypothetical protein